VIAIDVRDLVGRPGSSRELQVNQPVEGLRLELAGVPEDRPVHGDLLLESVVEGILVSGPLVGRAAMSCARCLRGFEVDVDVEVQELFVPEAESEGDEYPLKPPGSVDLEPMIRDALLTAMPFSPLCRPDCLGLCERCGGDRNLGECSCPPRLDPRWDALAPLQGLFEDA
jgi:uncharacterized protein